MRLMQSVSEQTKKWHFIQTLQHAVTIRILYRQRKGKRRSKRTRRKERRRRKKRRKKERRRFVKDYSLG